MFLSKKIRFPVRLNPRMLSVVTTKFLEDYFQDKQLDLKSAPTYFYWRKSNPIVEEELTFTSRDAEIDSVIKSFQTRRAFRDRALRPNAKSDKSRNHITAICGSPGIGKSAFLANFPDHSAYSDYLGKRGLSSPIVSSFSYNSAMDYSIDGDSGVRVLYGAFCSMCPAFEILKSTTHRTLWEEFLAKIPLISISDAVELVSEIFGRDRPLLLLVDELSKAKFNADTQIMNELGELLGRIENLDMIVSSLSTQYVETLLTGSQRSVDYIVLPPLLNSNIGVDKTKDWVKKVLETSVKKDYLKDKGVDYDLLESFLTSVPLLVSNHPRSVEWLVGLLDLEKVDEWADLVPDCTTNYSINFLELIIEFSKKISGKPRFENFNLNFDKKTIVFILSTKPIDIKSKISKIARLKVESGDLLPTPVLQRELVGKYHLLVRFISFIKFLEEISSKELLWRIYRFLVQHLEEISPTIAKLLPRSLLPDVDLLFSPLLLPASTFQVSDLMERSVALTILARSRDYKLLYSTLFPNQSGLSTPKFPLDFKSTSCTNLTLLLSPPTTTSENSTSSSSSQPSNYQQVSEQLRKLKALNQLLLFPPTFKGSDMRLIVKNKIIYIQVKIMRSSNSEKTPCTMTAKTVFHTLSSHFDLELGSSPLDEVYVMMYPSWDEQDMNDLKSKWSEVVNSLKKAINGKLEKNKVEGGKEAESEYWEDVLVRLDGGWLDRHVYVMGLDQMSHWLLPSLVTVPYLVNGIERGTGIRRQKNE